MGRLWLLILFFPLCSVAQDKTDSLRALLDEARRHGHTELHAYHAYQIASDFSRRQQLDSALFYFNESLKNEHGISDAQRASSLNAKGGVFDRMGMPDSSINSYLRSQTLYDALHDTASLVIVETNLSAIYMTKGWYDKSLEFAFRSLDKLEKKQASRALASCYNTLAFVYMHIGDFTRSVEYHRKALAARREIKYARGVGQSLNNIGETFIQLGELDSALQYLLAARQVKDSLGERPTATLNNLGLVYFRLGKMEAATSSLLLALSLGKEEDNVLAQVRSLHALARVYLARKEFVSCNTSLRAAERLLQQADALEEKRENAELFINLHKQQNQPQLALIYFEKLTTIKDQILTRQKIESLAAMQAKYESEKKEQQIRLLARDNEIQDTRLQLNTLWIRGLVVSAILLISIVILVWNQYRLTRQSKAKAEMFLRELNHRVKNNLQVLSSILTLQSLELKDEAALQAIKSNEGRVNAMALIHRKLYSHGAEQSIQLKEYVTELVSYLAQTFGFANGRLDLVLEIEDIPLHVDKAIPLGLILNELVTNAFKYAFADRYPGKLSITLFKRHGVDLVVIVADNGKGMPQTVNSENPTSFGLRMVAMLMRELKGQHRVTNNDGTQTELIIPYLN